MATTITASAQDGEAVTTSKTFSRETAITIRIPAKAEIIWALLTNAADFPRWNSTVTSIDGKIAQGETIKVKVKIDPKRVFKLKVKDFEPKARMTWVSGAAPFFKGVRTYTLISNPDGSTTVSMVERMGGLMFPMAAKSIPDFKQPFEQYMADLKREAEAVSKVK